MRRAIITGIVIVVVIPLMFVAYRNWDALQEAIYKTKFLTRRSSTPSQKYSAATKTPEATIALVDTAFLDYITETLHVYDVDAIADPERYMDKKASVVRHTVSRLTFELVPTLERYIVALGGSMDFAGRGMYAVEGDTLVIRVSLNEEELVKSHGPVKYNMEDMYLDTALQTLLYATAKPGTSISPVELARVQKAIKDNISSGIFPRPVSIEAQK